MTPLLSRLHDRFLRSSHEQDGFPARQLFVLALCRLCEPIAFMSVFPYAYRMIESFQVTQDESQISIYAGMLITAFAFAEFSTGMIWGRVSDRVGRKPVLISGLVGTAISMICFGFSTNLWFAILSRALGGLLNGNVGVLQTTVAELVKKKEHQPRAYSVMPFVWCLGSIIGPAMGGALAMPTGSYPWLFSKDSLFDRFPFLLPNLVCVIILIFGIANGILFIEETHPDFKGRKDRGRELGYHLVEKLCGKRLKSGSEYKYYDLNDEHGRLSFDPPPGYRSIENSPRLGSSPTPSIPDDLEGNQLKCSRGISATFTRQVVCIIIGYGILAYHSVSFDSLMPVMMSEAPDKSKPSLPFKFVGGFGLTTKTIGLMMAVQGIYSMIAQLWLFPIVVRRVGTLRAFRLVMLAWPLLYFATPYLVLLPQWLQTSGVYAALLCKISFHVVAFPSIAILLANAAPSNTVLGTINGVAASTACLCRAFGPTATGAIHSAGLRLGYGGLAWWAAGLVCIVGAVESFYIQESDPDTSPPCRTDDDSPVPEPLLTATIEEQETRSEPPINISALDLSKDVKA